MASAREGSSLLRTVARRNFGVNVPVQCRRAFASLSKSNDLADLDSASSFDSPAPQNEDIQAFNDAPKLSAKDRNLPGNRYQYHPPKYYRGPLHPVQMPKSSDPTARDFVPGPFNLPRLKHTYDSTIAPDMLTLAYKHTPPGTVEPESMKGHLRQWDGSSPYHKNRPARGPRGGGSSRLGLIERDIEWHRIPEISAVSIHSFTPAAGQNKEYLQVNRAVLQAITGEFPEVTTVKTGVVQWGVRKGDKTGSKVTIRGGAAYEFVDKLVTLVLPKIKDWPGIQATTGDGSGNLAFGMKPEWMSYFPELEFNYDMYPARLVPGCDIYIHTTGTSDRQGRLLLEALGFPFYGKMKRR
jgi:large subunit ribosomal protein L5